MLTICTSSATSKFTLCLLPLDSHLSQLAQRLDSKGATSSSSPLITLFTINTSSTISELLQRIKAGLAEWRDDETFKHSTPVISLTIEGGSSLMMSSSGAALAQRNPDYVKGYTFPDSVNFGVEEVVLDGEGRVVVHFEGLKEAEDLLHYVLNASVARDQVEDDAEEDEEEEELPEAGTPELVLFKTASREDAEQQLNDLKRDGEIIEGEDVTSIRGVDSVAVKELVVLEGSAEQGMEVVRISLVG